LASASGGLDFSIGVTFNTPFSKPIDLIGDESLMANGFVKFTLQHQHRWGMCR
jgi:hypothetical protein